MPLVDLHHFNVKSRNLDATKVFYLDVLGMTLANRPDFDFPGAWFNAGATQVHVMAGKAAFDHDGSRPYGSAAVDHIAFQAHDFDAMKNTLIERGLDWRQLAIPPANLWQLFVHDPDGLLIELNFDVAKEPVGAKGPDGSNLYVPGRFFPAAITNGEGR